MSSFGPALPSFIELAPGVRRIVAPNPSMMTGPGTNTYLFGTDEVAVIDPGPALARHIEHIASVGAGKIRHILVTHTHKDHSPGAAELRAITGARIYGMAAPDGEHQDKTFAPDVLIRDGDQVAVDGITIEAIHTPGHASNHVCYHHKELHWVCTGDHVIDGSTVVIDPPDGSMVQYLGSLERLKALQADALLPGHGDRIDMPDEVIDWIIHHRLQREAKVAAALRQNPGLTSMQLVPHVYDDVDERLYRFAERSLLAHLEKLEHDGVALVSEQRWTSA